MTNKAKNKKPSSITIPYFEWEWMLKEDEKRGKIIKDMNLEGLRLLNKVRKLKAEISVLRAKLKEANNG